MIRSLGVALTILTDLEINQDSTNHIEFPTQPFKITGFAPNMQGEVKEKKKRTGYFLLYNML